MSEPWLSVIGLGEEGLDGLAPAARPLFDQAEILMGGRRHLAMLDNDPREKIEWPSPLRAIEERLKNLSGRKVCVLATGDPQWFGIGFNLGSDFCRGRNADCARPFGIFARRVTHGLVAG